MLFDCPRCKNLWIVSHDSWEYTGHSSGWRIDCYCPDCTETMERGWDK